MPLIKSEEDLRHCHQAGSPEIASMHHNATLLPPRLDPQQQQVMMQLWMQQQQQQQQLVAAQQQMKMDQEGSRLKAMLMRPNETPSLLNPSAQGMRTAVRDAVDISVEDARMASPPKRGSTPKNSCALTSECGG